MEDEPLLFDDEQVDDQPDQPAKQKPKRLRQARTKVDLMLEQYEFMASDEDEHESSSNKEERLLKERKLDEEFIADEEARDDDDHNPEIVSKEVREAMGIIDEGPEMLKAFRMLAVNDVDGFLDSGVMQYKFRLVYLVLGSFGVGRYAEAMFKLFRRFFQSKIQVERRNFTWKQECMACAISRETSFEFFNEIGESLGIMGSDCYGIKMVEIMKLAENCLLLASLLDSCTEAEFINLASRNIDTSLAPIIEAPEKMQERYKDVYPGTNIKKPEAERVPVKKLRKISQATKKRLEREQRNRARREELMASRRLKTMDLTGDAVVAEYH